MKKGILLINLGTPDSPSVKDVRRFLREFLMDPLVVDMPFLARWLLVNCIIVPFRGPKSALEYQQLWTEKGSPLKVHSENLASSLAEKLAGKYSLAMAMRYQNPSIASGLEKLKQAGCEQLLILPLFPQYAEATTLSTLNKVAEEITAMNWQVECRQLTSFATNEGFIDALVYKAKAMDIKAIEHTVFSYHGLPERQLKKLNQQCLENSCCAAITAQNQNCYRAQCYATSRAIAEKLQLSEQQYTVCFQSRQGNIPWLQPYMEDVISKLAKKGHRHIMVFSPSFVADCLETTIEISQTYRALFRASGGKDLYLVPGLNDSELWVKNLSKIIIRELADI